MHFLSEWLIFLALRLTNNAKVDLSSYHFDSYPSKGICCTVAVMINGCFLRKMLQSQSLQSKTTVRVRLCSAGEGCGNVYLNSIGLELSNEFLQCCFLHCCLFQWLVAYFKKEFLKIRAWLFRSFFSELTMECAEKKMWHMGTEQSSSNWKVTAQL